MPQPVSRRVVLSGSTLVAATAMIQDAQAQGSWKPKRPIRVVVPYTAGGASDVTARLIAEGLHSQLGQPVLVENRPGATGIIGTETVARARPDGHTLALVASSHVVNAALFPALPYDPLRDFAPVILTARVHLVMVVPSSHPARGVPDFIDWAQAQGGRAAYASSGIGSNPHIFAADLLHRAGVKMEHIPYRGSTAAHADLLAGRTSMMFDAYAAVRPHVVAGALRAVAVAGPERTLLLPELATVAEGGFPGYGGTSWGCILAPAGTPTEAVEVLNTVAGVTLATLRLRERLALLGAEPAGGSPEALRIFMEQEQKRYAALVSALSIQGHM
ncbi:tripartite tricarboxylate transporter substrate binding protein [Roseomonas sp. KE2513]|uniref:tripartite tricarboxylate transporter substrate-binding protein n=1 Tax=Roseomonas sp. KE2513 TaxID=2479202 RepID=UPI0018DF6CA8|nr:tripartite tricarboxylate transporter substrate-binding protein [Roseomonas sp. KE2513]MBI0539436.1 tripartite tricarboxylate transporter substrate binding protein [Roseomonas sp. KE2513]